MLHYGSAAGGAKTVVNFSGKTAMITGASSGIGRACALRLAREGVRLILTARREEALKETAAGAAPAEAQVIPADLGDRASLAALCDEVKQRFGTLDILVNNAGVGLYAPAAEAAPELVERMFALNYFAPVELTRRLTPLIPSGGAIVNVSSIAGKVPLPWMTHYSSSKYALNAFSDGLRIELKRRGVQVLSVCPGYVGTEFGQNVLQGRIPDKVAGQRRFKITAEECAEALVEGLRAGKRTVVTPRIGWLLIAATRLFPGLVFSRMAKMTPPAPDAESVESWGQA